MRRLLPYLVVVLAGCSQSSDPAVTRVAYQCESGRVVHVSHPSDSSAIVEYQGRTVQMTNAISASGARYVGEDLEWWSKGTGPGSDAAQPRHRALD